MRNFETYIKEEKVLLCDGAMGTYLHQKGVPLYHTFPGLNLKTPDLVKSVHIEYIKAGAQLIETNTFGANSIKLREYGLEERTYEINLKGSQIARESAGRNIFVGGSVGPSGKALEPFGPLTKKELKEAIEPQIQGLVDGGVDALFIETQILKEEAEEIIRIAREIAPHIPLVSIFSFMEDGKTPYGTTPEEVVELGKRYSVSAIGANCGVGPTLLEDVILRMREQGLPLCVMPNAGMPTFKGGDFYFPVHPEHFAKYALRFLSIGVKIIGSCCGTGPKHTLYMSQVFREARQGGNVVEPLYVETKKKSPPKVKKHIKREKNIIWEKLSNKKLITIEVLPPRGVSYDKVLSFIKDLKKSGIDVVNVVDLPMARLRMNPVAFAHIMKRDAGIEPILHFTCRDRNLLGIQADLLGAYALGIRTILALTGDPPSIGDYPHATAIYDVTAEGLIRIINLLNNSTDFSGRQLNLSTDFLIIASCNPSSKIEPEISKIKEKIKLGAKAFITQPVYDQEKIKNFLKFYPERFPIIIGFMPPKSLKQAEYLAKEVPGIEIPATFLNRIEKAEKNGEDVKRVSVEHSIEILKEIKELIDGIYLIPPEHNMKYIQPFVKAFKKKSTSNP